MRWQYNLRRADVDDEEERASLIALHRATFEADAPIVDGPGCIFDRGAWWLMRVLDEPIGFCGVVKSTYDPTYAYLKRAGVLKEHRGQRLQNRMIYVREKWARSEGFQWLITNCSNNNPSSGNSLIRAGFRMWWPEVPWDLKTAVYFRKQLQAL